MGSTRGGGWGRPGPPSGEHDQQLTTSRRGDNSLMEHEKDGKKSQTWQRGPIVHRVRIINVFNVLYKCILTVPVCIFNAVELSFIVSPLSCLFQENKLYGDKPFAFILWCMSSSHLAHLILYVQQRIIIQSFICFGEKLQPLHYFKKTVRFFARRFFLLILYTTAPHGKWLAVPLLEVGYRTPNSS
jgi:hypothetical protein